MVLRLLWAVTALLAVGAVLHAGTPAEDSPLLALVDHLVYATPDLDRSVADLERRFGVRASPGGQHPGKGTRNALLALGPASYLEIVGPDPSQPAPASPRAFGIDSLKEPRLVAWAAKGKDLERLRERTGRYGIPLGEVTTGSRKRPDGVVLSWKFTNPAKVLVDGLIPFFIDWGQSPHPAESAAPGLKLVELRAEHPAPQAVEPTLRTLGLDLRVSTAPTPALVAIIDGPRGRVELR